MVSNDFNSINREAFLHNTEVLCPALATFINKCYSIPSDLFLEGTTQGDPAAMAIYSLGFKPTVSMVKQFVKRKNRKVSIKASSICRWP